jgi:ligand-binding sensor domain-containing protein/AraC-like DNA-binding protein
MNLKTILLYGLFSLFVGTSAAQSVLTDQYNMTCLDLSTGLPHNNVNQVFADSQGFIWISTYGGGVVRYDGYSFNRLEAKGLMVSNSSKGFAEDGHRRLWVAFDEGTVVIDMRTMSRLTPSYGDSHIGDRLRQQSVKVYCDSKGSLWQVTRDSVFRYTFDEEGHVVHISRCRYHGNTPDITLCDIESNGTVWINIEDGLYRLVEAGDKLIKKNTASAMQQLHGLYITDLLKRNWTVWIATNQGLYAYNQKQKTLSAYRHTTSPSSLAHDHASSLAVASDGRLLVGTLRGMDVFDEQHGTFEHWNSSTVGEPMPSDFVHCLMVREGQIWIGTETAGVVKLAPKPLMLQHYVHQPDKVTSLSRGPVNAMYAAPDGSLWAGTVEGGLNRKEGRGENFTHWSMFDLGLKYNSVSVLEPDVHDRLWIGSWGGGLNYISLSARDQVHHVTMPESMAPLTNYIGSLAYDKYHDALWIGSNDGVFYYDLKTGVLKDPFKGNRTIRGCIGSHIDRDGNLWIGCLLGAFVVNLKTPTFSHRLFRNKLNNPESPVVDKICCFCEASDGTMWLGSNGYGLYKRVVSSDGKWTFEVLTTDDGLANNAVKGIVEDEQGRLWITTDNGMSVYNPRTRTFNNYSQRDGLPCQRFYWNSAVKGADGTVYLGSLDGLTEIKGENTEIQYSNHLTFTRLLVDNQEVTAANSDILDADISQASCIRLHESNKSFSISFSTLTYGGESQGRYSYRLKGFDDEWTVLNPTENSVRYTTLKPGKYTFEVEYTDGIDAEKSVISIQVVVAPYFWKSWWFVLLLLLLLAGVAMWIYRQRIDKLRQQEAEKLLQPIRRVLDESDDPEQLQSRIQNILDNHERLQKSYRRTLEADKQEVLRTKKSFMERATEVMEQNYMNSEFGIAELAEALGVSRTLLSKRLNAETGQSTGQFIRNYRLSVAKSMILENQGNRNITEIAYRVGFNDPKYFTRCFTRRYGNSPSSYTGEDTLVDK